MTSGSNNEQNRYLQSRINVNPDEKKNNNDITNHRHSIINDNFREAAYRSLSLPYENNESNHILLYIKYCIRVFLLCLFILLIGSFIKIIWCLNRH